MTTVAASMRIGQMTANELAFAKMNPSGDNYIVQASTSGVVTVARASTWGSPSLIGLTKFITGPAVAINASMFSGDSLQQLEIKSTSKIWSSSNVFSNVASSCALVLWQPIANFRSSSMRGCPSTVYFKNAELNEILAAADTIGLGKNVSGDPSEVTVYDMYGKSCVVGSGSTL